MQAKKLALHAKEACEEKKGVDCVILDLKRFDHIASYFVIASGESNRHIRAIANHVIEIFEMQKVGNGHLEGLEGDSSWVLLDFGEVVVHVFDQEMRCFYNLERLWGDAPRVME